MQYMYRCRVENSIKRGNGECRSHNENAFEMPWTCVQQFSIIKVCYYFIIILQYIIMHACPLHLYQTQTWELVMMSYFSYLLADTHSLIVLLWIAY